MLAPKITYKFCSPYSITRIVEKFTNKLFEVVRSHICKSSGELSFNSSRILINLQPYARQIQDFTPRGTELPLVLESENLAYFSVETTTIVGETRVRLQAPISCNFLAIGAV